jgi:hypothetical protein
MYYNKKDNIKLTNNRNCMGGIMKKSTLLLILMIVILALPSFCIAESYSGTPFKRTQTLLTTGKVYADVPMQGGYLLKIVKKNGKYIWESSPGQSELIKRENKRIIIFNSKNGDGYIIIYKDTGRYAEHCTNFNPIFIDCDATETFIGLLNLE